MIDRSEVLTIAGERDLQVDMIEKDYVLGWMLTGIFAHPVLGPRRWTGPGPRYKHEPRLVEKYLQPANIILEPVCSEIADSPTIMGT